MVKSHDSATLLIIESRDRPGLDSVTSRYCAYLDGQTARSNCFSRSNLYRSSDSLCALTRTSVAAVKSRATLLQRSNNWSNPCSGQKQADPLRRTASLWRAFQLKHRSFAMVKPPDPVVKSDSKGPKAREVRSPVFGVEKASDSSGQTARFWCSDGPPSTPSNRLSDRTEYSCQTLSVVKH